MTFSPIQAFKLFQHEVLFVGFCCCLVGPVMVLSPGTWLSHVPRLQLSDRSVSPATISSMWSTVGQSGFSAHDDGSKMGMYVSSVANHQSSMEFHLKIQGDGVSFLLLDLELRDAFFFFSWRASCLWRETLRSATRRSHDKQNQVGEREGIWNIWCCDPDPPMPWIS